MRNRLADSTNVSHGVTAHNSQRMAAPRVRIGVSAIEQTVSAANVQQAVRLRPSRAQRESKGLAMAALRRKTPRELFALFDADGSGEIDFVEVRRD